MKWTEIIIGDVVADVHTDGSLLCVFVDRTNNYVSWMRLEDGSTTDGTLTKNHRIFNYKVYREGTLIYEP